MLSGVASCSICGKYLTAGGTSGGHDKIPYTTYNCIQGRYGIGSIHVKYGDRVIQIKTLALEDAVLRVLRQELTLPPPGSAKPKRNKAIRTTDDVDREMRETT